jgi:predicted ATPase/class 3 adenylate cyclase
MDALPSGVVTFCFTDIEASTPLLASLGSEAYQEVLEAHRLLVRTAAFSCGGAEVRTEGDGMFFAFSSADDAVMACLEAQRALLGHRWPPEASVRVRMGLHTGEGTVTSDRDYLGLAIHQAARVMTAAHGGQVLVSDAVLARLSDFDQVEFRDLGEFSLRGIEGVTRLHQLCHPELPSSFPPPRAPAAGVHNLPAQLTSFIGRETEIADISSLLGVRRLVTLTGAGGCGKSRLALQVVTELLDAFEDGVWLVELAPVADPKLVTATVCSALGVREEPGHQLKDTLIGSVSGRRLLLVLDNCEHLLQACADLTDLMLRSCPHLNVLTTSREPLGIEGEQLYRVPSLSLPDADDAFDLEDAVGFDAVHLFVDRANAQVPTFPFDDATLNAVVSLCRKLDGMPLAIELAAARVSSLSVAEIETRLDDRFRLLTKGRRTALPRHQTLRALIDWSYDALTSEEQDVLRRLSVFAGGWDLDACQIVCSLDSLAETEVVDVLGSLVSKSLVQAEPATEGLRYGLLETIRQYGAEKLAEVGSDEPVSTRSAHAGLFLDFAESAAAQLRGPDQIFWFDRLEEEYENIRAAFSHLSEQSRNSDVLRMAGALKEYWVRRGYFDEGFQILDHALAKSDIEDTHVLAVALIAAGRLGNHMRRGPLSHAQLLEALELSHQMEDVSLTSTALIELTYSSEHQGDYRSAERWVAEAIECASRTTDPRLLGEAHLAKAKIPSRKDRSAARQDCLDAISLFSEANDPCGLAGAELALANLDVRDGDLEAAHRRLSKILHEYRDSKDDLQLLSLHTYFGLIEVLGGDTSSAERSFKEGLRLAIQVGLRPVLFNNLVGLAGCASAVADNERAAMLYGAASMLMDHVQMVLDPSLDRLCESDKMRLRSQMGDSEFAAAFESGRRLPTSDAIQLALEREAL